VTVAVLTDSTACLTPRAAAESGVEVVPLHVVVGRRTYAEGVDISAAEVADLLRRGKERVSTSRPAPGELIQRYRQLRERTGCEAIVSLHLSGRVSGTVEAAQLAAAAVRSEVRVEVVDTGVLGMAMGYAACSAAQAAAAGASPEEVLVTARERAAATSTLFYLDSLEHLRRGGRVGTAAALLGSALAIKPLLTLRDGQVEMLEKVRTRNRALARLEERCVELARQPGHDGVDLAVHHLSWGEQADALRRRLAEALPAAQVDLVELGAVVAVHTGPGTLAVVVAPRATATTPSG
jgi:DegV family protein with EDD domain